MEEPSDVAKDYVLRRSRRRAGAAFWGALAQDTVKIGLILPMTGQQTSTGKQIDAAA